MERMTISAEPKRPSYMAYSIVAAILALALVMLVVAKYNVTHEPSTIPSVQSPQSNR